MAKGKVNDAVKEPGAKSVSAQTLPESSEQEQPKSEVNEQVHVPENINNGVPDTAQKDAAPEAMKEENTQAETVTAQIVAPSTVFVAVNYPQSVKFTVLDKNGLPCDLILNGNATELRGKEMGILPVGAYGLTKVDADAWAYIKRKYAGLPLIKNGLIFATERNERYAKDAAAERKEERNGFEPVDPNKTNTKPDDGKNI